MFEPGASQRFCDASWFIFINSAGSSGFDITESAGAGAGVSKDHDGCDPTRPALSDVGTRRFFADGVEIVGVDIGFSFSESLAAGEFGAKPIRFFLGCQVLEGVVLVVENHPRERNDGLEIGDGIAAESAWVSIEGARGSHIDRR